MLLRTLFSFIHIFLACAVIVTEGYELEDDVENILSVEISPAQLIGSVNFIRGQDVVDPSRVFVAPGDHHRGISEGRGSRYVDTVVFEIPFDDHSSNEDPFRGIVVMLRDQVSKYHASTVDSTSNSIKDGQQEEEELIFEEGSEVIEIYIFNVKSNVLLWWTSFQNTKEVNYFELKSNVLSPNITGNGNVDVVENDIVKNDSLFSSFHCLYGSQRFPWGWSTDYSNLFPTTERELQTNRVCVYKNICLSHNHEKWWYFRDSSSPEPDFMTMSEESPLQHLHSQTFVWELRGEHQSIISVLNKSIPTKRVIFKDPDKVYFYQEQSQSYNFAHCILEDLLPVQMVMDIFDLGPLEKAHVIHNCLGGLFVNDRNINEKTLLCRKNIKLYSSLLGLKACDDNEIKGLLEEEGEYTCFPTVVMGHSMAFSQWHTDKHVSRYLRQFRDKVVDKFGFSNLKTPTSHKVLVLGKGSFDSIPSATQTEWPSLCKDVTALVVALERSSSSKHRDDVIPVQCLVPSADNLKALVYALQVATVVVSEHGTIPMNSMFFGREGLVHIVGCGESSCKVNPVFTSVHIRYLFINDSRDLRNTLQYALIIASQTFHIKSKN